MGKRHPFYGDFPLGVHWESLRITKGLPTRGSRPGEPHPLTRYHGNHPKELAEKYSGELARTLGNGWEPDVFLGTPEKEFGGVSALNEDLQLKVSIGLNAAKFAVYTVPFYKPGGLAFHEWVDTMPEVRGLISQHKRGRQDSSQG